MLGCMPWARFLPATVRVLVRSCEGKCCLDVLVYSSKVIIDYLRKQQLDQAFVFFQLSFASSLFECQIYDHLASDQEALSRAPRPQLFAVAFCCDLCACRGSPCEMFHSIED